MCTKDLLKNSPNAIMCFLYACPFPDLNSLCVVVAYPTGPRWILIGEHPSATVATVGHSLGAALALLDGVYPRLQLDPSIRVRVIGYGLPRVGNQDFANYARMWCTSTT